MRQILDDFVLGLSYWFRSWGFILRQGLTHYFIYPLLIAIILGMGLMAGISTGVDLLMEWIAPSLTGPGTNGDASFWQQATQILKGLGTTALRFSLWLLATYLVWKMNKYLVLIVMSPVMALLSERTEQRLTGKTYPFNGPQFVRDVFRGIGLALRNILMELILVLGVLALNLAITVLIPGITIVSTPAASLFIFFIGCYFYGFSVMDYTHERQRLSMGQSIRLVRSRKGLAAGLGVAFSVLMWLPVIGVTLATITCTVAATLAVLNKEGKRKQ